MRICIINPFYDPWVASHLEVTGRYRHVEALSAALACRNHDVVVVQALHEDRIERRNSVEFRYARAPQRPPARLAGGPLGIDLIRRTNLRRIIESVADARPDAVHLIGLTLLQPLLEVGLWCGKRDLPLTVSYHGGVPRREPWLHRFQYRALQQCKHVFFTNVAQARPWVEAGLLREEQVIPTMEVSSSFAPIDRHEARARTKMTGNPIFAWNGRLHPVKDPLTALRGFALIRRHWPDARLYMIYLTNEMQADVAQAIAGNPALKDSVELRGTVPPHAVEDFLNSADFFLQSSVREYSGYSVLEAMSCGVIPIVTDIPAFRAMTNEGACGIHFPVGDSELMARRTLACDLQNLGELSRKVRDHFVHFLSYPAIAEVYETALQPKQHTMRPQ